MCTVTVRSNGIAEFAGEPNGALIVTAVTTLGTSLGTAFTSIGTLLTSKASGM